MTRREIHAGSEESSAADDGLGRLVVPVWPVNKASHSGLHSVIERSAYRAKCARVQKASLAAPRSQGCSKRKVYRSTLTSAITRAQVRPSFGSGSEFER